MQFTWQELWQHMGAPALIVAGTLLVMGFLSLMVFLERLLTFTWSRWTSRRFARVVRPLRAEGNLRAVAEKSKAFSRGYLARVMGAGLETYFHATHHHAGGLSPLEKTQRHMERYLEQVGAELRRGFTVLAAVGSIAPFVGLLGTVLGIISAFQGIADTGSGGLSAVAGGISEALVETALGLTVAIPAVLAYNFSVGAGQRRGNAAQKCARRVARPDRGLGGVGQVGGDGASGGAGRWRLSAGRERIAEHRCRRRAVGMKRRSLRGHYAAVEPEINVTPLVDVVLVLLIIFMVVVPQMQEGAASGTAAGVPCGPGTQSHAGSMVSHGHPLGGDLLWRAEARRRRDPRTCSSGCGRAMRTGAWWCVRTRGSRGRRCARC
ncbi:MAG: hypothetical protein KatS3mg077_2160 [Candidatus Binatia bacterium]|nr:MAG: hypothetical protein KatS3mg077_2160 [Candidatus Binatia bacterium]